jgi:hypothetical protein
MFFGGGGDAEADESLSVAAFVAAGAAVAAVAAVADESERLSGRSRCSDMLLS